MTSILDNKNTSAPSVFLPAALLREARRQKGLADARCAADLHSRSGRRYRAAAQANGPGAPVRGMALLSHQLDTFELAGTNRGHHRLCGRRVIRRFGGGRAVCLRLPVAAERHLGRANHAQRAAAVFCDHRSGVARRRHELSLRAAIGIRRRRTWQLVQMASKALAGNKATRGRRIDMDHGCSVSRDGGGDRDGALQGRACGRDGSGGALYVCIAPQA